jgi:hypothetical protein
MTRHRRPEWGRPRIPCRPPRDMLLRYGAERAYAGITVMLRGVEQIDQADDEAYRRWAGSMGSRDWVGPEGLALNQPRVDTANAVEGAWEGPRVSWWRRLLRLLGERLGVA